MKLHSQKHIQYFFQEYYNKCQYVVYVYVTHCFRKIPQISFFCFSVIKGEKGVDHQSFSLLCWYELQCLTVKTFKYLKLCGNNKANTLQVRT